MIVSSCQIAGFYILNKPVVASVGADVTVTVACTLAADANIIGFTKNADMINDDDANDNPIRKLMNQPVHIASDETGVAVVAGEANKQHVITGLILSSDNAAAAVTVADGLTTVLAFHLDVPGGGP